MVFMQLFKLLVWLFRLLSSINQATQDFLTVPPEKYGIIIKKFAALHIPHLVD